MPQELKNEMERERRERRELEEAVEDLKSRLGDAERDMFLASKQREVIRLFG